MNNKIFLSKSKIKQNDQCEKMLWLELNKRDEGFWEASDQAKFTQGRDVEQLARNEFPNAVLMDKIKNEDKLKQTNEFLKKHNVIFEASFSYSNTIVQFDILINNGDGTYNAIEVKSGGSFKPDYLDDVTLQYWITTKSGKITIKNYQVWFVNTNNDSGNMSEFFTKVDVMDKILLNYQRFETLLQKSLETAYLKIEPTKNLGQHCSKPYSCKFWNYCSKNTSKGTDSVLNLPYFPNKYQALAKGINTINHPEFDKTFKYSEQNPLIIESIKKNRVIINQDGINNDFGKWVFPLNFFDFETLTTAVPILAGQKPYRQMTFQYSLHILEKNNNITHFEFLHDSFESPNKSVIESMLKSLNNEGSIVAYNKSFEMTRIRELAIANPEFKEPLLALLERFVDLMDLVKDNVYHPEFRGSYSLKSVSPALLGYKNGGYTDSTIKNGGEISKYYIEFLQTKDLDRKEELKKALLKYCKYDTANLILLMQWLLDQKADVDSWIEKSVTNITSIAS